MNLKRFFKQRIVIISIVLIILTGGLGTLAWNNDAWRGVQGATLGLFWLNVAEFRQAQLIPGGMCSFESYHHPFGFPFLFFDIIDTCGGSETLIKFNPIAVLVNFVIFAVIGHLYPGNNEKITKSRK